jgi:hypothetical protein
MNREAHRGAKVQMGAQMQAGQSWQEAAIRGLYMPLCEASSTGAWRNFHYVHSKMYQRGLERWEEHLEAMKRAAEAAAMPTSPFDRGSRLTAA